jgi:hypothetical protein
LLFQGWVLYYYKYDAPDVRMNLPVRPREKSFVLVNSFIKSEDPDEYRLDLSFSSSIRVALVCCVNNIMKMKKQNKMSDENSIIRLF